MNIFEKLTDSQTWDEYFLYKKERRHLTKSEEKDLAEYIEGKEYIEAVEKLFDFNDMPIPEKKLIRKMQTDKKRVVYMYPREVNYVIKLMTFLLLRKYDDIFSPSLYSFRVNTGVGKAIGRILRAPGLKTSYTYKVDISNYFNSIPVEKMCEKLRVVMAGEPQLLKLFEGLLKDERVLDKGNVISEEKGVMAGTPFAVFLANLYLMDLDTAMDKEEDLLYARYSDDIIVFAQDEKRREEASSFIKSTLAEKDLCVNEKKEIRTNPGESWSFLGIGYLNGKVDISSVSKEKIKSKMRRKARALKRWQIKKGVSGERAIKGFINAMNKKFFDPDSSHELTWARWYFPVINTDETLKELDRYMQYWIRYLATGKHNKKSYEFTYEDMKALGYISLVHEWYKES